jgi:hypothetical protein
MMKNDLLVMVAAYIWGDTYVTASGGRRQATDD